MSQTQLDQLIEKIIASFDEEDAWTHDWSHNLESYAHKSGISVFKKEDFDGFDSMDQFYMTHGERRMALSNDDGRRIWSSAEAMKPQNKFSNKDAQWFLDRFDNKN